MILSFSQISNLAVFEKTNLSMPIAIIRDVIIDSDNGAVKGFWVHDGSCLKILLESDIEQYITGRVIINNEQSLQLPNKLPVLKTVFKRDHPILSAKVFVKKKNIGSVSEFFIDTKSNFLVSLFVKKWWFGKKTTVMRYQIIKISEQGIFVDLEKLESNNVQKSFKKDMPIAPVSEKNI